ncbi:hypothetical protein PENSPDRAFT_647487 [Peniophora sp. CONT]|nr:hypothetical protein PENSPDRAFT_647487 [Peniophora sp. CONT]
MYLRAIHAEDHLPTLRALVRAHPLGTFTTVISSPQFPLLQSTYIPFVLDIADESSESELGTLRGHMARANPHSKAMIENLSGREEALQVLENEVMVLFNGPVDHYVTPKFYTETKPDTGKVVPTWNYAAVEVRGRARVYFDSKSQETGAFLDKQVRALTGLCEGEIMGYEKQWSVEDAPGSYIEILKKAIIGVEIEVTSMVGKWKMNQEISEGDRKGVVEGFNGLGTDAGKCMAHVVKERAEIVERKKAESK